MLNISVSGPARTFAASFSNRLGIPSKPLAFLGFSSLSAFRVSATVMSRIVNFSEWFVGRSHLRKHCPAEAYAEVKFLATLTKKWLKLLDLTLFSSESVYCLKVLVVVVIHFDEQIREPLLTATTTATTTTTTAAAILFNDFACIKHTWITYLNNIEKSIYIKLVCSKSSLNRSVLTTGAGGKVLPIFRW